MNFSQLRHRDTVEVDREEEPWRSENVVAVARRQEPLVNLVEFSLCTPYDIVWKSVTDLRSMFTHCLNIKCLSMEINMAAREREITSFGRFIGQECPKIENLSYGCDCALVHDRLGYSILESLPAQQVTNFIYDGVIGTTHMPAITVSVLQHATSLRELRIQEASLFENISASAIFRECRNLEILYIGLLYTGGLCVSLDDSLEHPWACTKLTHLTLAISGCALPYEPGVLVYFRRPTPVTLTEVETQHFARLKELYRRIGALKELRELDLSMSSIDEAGLVDARCLEDQLSFPAMMNLMSAQNGRPGFLQLLSGLKKLEVLQGAVSAWSDETEVTVGWPEVVWIDQNWPSLRHADFFLDEDDVSEPFAWLRKRKQDSGQGLRIVSDMYE
ncbi:hypothetical protein BGZ96_008432 [Linnemannia gamsii]|uniref:Uncharacterized protein n=1 Tax=Linnemannia gamsii TaxID=64522 RepID=A0ABQ7KE91_9FUNG|nr:hypothetical protein BGZ96_008432 [Linnemannia gamsii]